MSFPNMSNDHQRIRVRTTLFVVRVHQQFTIKHTSSATFLHLLRDIRALAVIVLCLPLTLIVHR